MEELRLAEQMVTAVLTLAMSTAWPPAETGAFWAVLALYGVVSVLFDDETPRGVPGMEDVRFRRRPPPEDNE